MVVRSGIRRVPPGGTTPRLVVLCAVLVAACSVEPRADTRSGGEGPADTGGSPVVDGDSAQVLGVVGAFHDALRVGDVARVAALSVPGALLVDQEEGVRWERGGDAARLPGPLDAAPGDGGLRWRVAERQVRPAGDARVVTLRWQAVIAGEPVEWWGVESLVLVPTDDGWRLMHVHRSRGGDPTPAAGAGEP
jgi:ketosteroid isomerase-like protein